MLFAARAAALSFLALATLILAAAAVGHDLETPAVVAFLSAGGLSACAQLTCQMVASAMGIDTERIAVHVEGDLDLRGTLGIDRSVSPGFEEIRLSFDVDAPGASDEELASLIEKTERYCTVLQTLRQPPPVESRTD